MILLTYGTRPEYIKIKPIISEFKRLGIQFKTLFTGQHKDIANGEFDYKLVMKDLGSNRLDSVLSNLMNLPDEIFDGINYILVQGDTTSVVGLALSALHRKIKVIHLEAGLRTNDNENPYPEENNRRIVSTLSYIHLCPTKENSENLKRENIYQNVFVVGNTVLDNLIEYQVKCEYTNKILVTMHRRENQDKIVKWFTEINNLANLYPEFEFILPIHPNPNVQKHKDLLKNVTVINPLNHEELLELLVKTRLVITDSGGIQEECSFFNKKCLVCRKVTERPESLGLTSFLVNEPENLSELFKIHIKDYIVDFESPYGDGKSSEKICKILKLFL
jgi:UDP-N-acetylglucosamine 2-epimerase (non-hydrolysing)